ncbi:MAG: hypothetical protein WC719_00005 [Patescibacteria group bacterium]|jgi:hypothetical protein
MKSHEIKQKIEILLDKYQKNSGTVKGFDILFEYVDFIKSEPYTANLLKPQFEYAQAQISLLDEYIAKNNCFKEVPNVHKIMEFKDISEVPMHKKAIAVGLEQLKNQEHANMAQMLPLAITQLVMVYEGMGRVKEQLKNKEEIDDKLNILQELPTSTIRVKVGEELNSLPFAVFAKTNLLISAKYILDKIDIEELSKETKKEPWFDKGKSILHFLGEEIQIARQKHRPTDHYILECIFSKDDISDPADFSEISEDFLKEDYDNIKGWNKFRHACEDLNTKVNVKTKTNDFILNSTEQLGWCKINPKYL